MRPVRHAISASLFCAPLILGGCGSREETPALGETQAEVLAAGSGTTYPGIRLSGVSYAGTSYNGISYNGISLNGVSFNGARYDGVSYPGVSYNGSVFLDGALTRGTKLVGSDLRDVNGSLSEATGEVNLLANGELGPPLAIRLGKGKKAGAPQRDLYYYDVSYQDGSGQRRPLCGTDAGGAALRATLVPGIWDTRSGVEGGGGYSESSGFTIACEHSTIEKCLRLGYKPWLEKDGRSLAPFLLACVRLLRADYCGDGQTWTVNGRMIELWDAAGVQAQARSWTFDAEWDERGARCIAHPRVRWSDGPGCLADKADALCGQAGFRPEVRMMDQFETELDLSSD